MKLNFNKLNYVPVDDQILVQPGPIKYITKSYTIPDDDKNRGKKVDDIHEVKTEVQRVRTELRIGTILRVSEKETSFKEGDLVVYPEGASRYFDLLIKKDEDKEREKCPVLVSRYRIVAIAKDTNIELNDTNE